MLRQVLITVIVLFSSATVWAAGTQYEIRVDGMAQPFRVYGLEKLLKRVEGVQRIAIDLNRGVITVQVAEGVTLTDPQLKKLCDDSGFTFRGMTATGM